FSLDTVITVGPNACQFPLENKEQLLNIRVQVQRSLVSRRDDHRTQCEVTSLDDLGIVVLAGSTAADVPHLSASVFRIHLGLKSKHIPVWLGIFERGDVFVDLIDGGNRIHSPSHCTHPEGVLEISQGYAIFAYPWK